MGEGASRGPEGRGEEGEAVGVVGEEAAFIASGGEMLDGEVAEKGSVLGELGSVEGGGETGDLLGELAGLEADGADEFRVVLLEGVGS